MIKEKTSKGRFATFFKISDSRRIENREQRGKGKNTARKKFEKIKLFSDWNCWDLFGKAEDGVDKERRRRDWRILDGKMRIMTFL